MQTAQQRNHSQNNIQTLGATAKTDATTVAHGGLEPAITGGWRPGASDDGPMGQWFNRTPGSWSLPGYKHLFVLFGYIRVMNPMYVTSPYVRCVLEGQTNLAQCFMRVPPLHLSLIHI